MTGNLPSNSAAPWVPPDGGRPKVLGSSDPRAMFAGYYRHPDGRPGAEIRIGDTRLNVIVGGNSSGKTAGVIIA